MPWKELLKPEDYLKDGRLVNKKTLFIAIFHLYLIVYCHYMKIKEKPLNV